MKLNVVGSQNQETGYGRMGREFIAGLRRQGVEIDDCASPDIVRTGDGTYQPVPSELDESKIVHANALWMGAPSHVGGWWEGQRTHVLTMWEATQVPPGFRDNVHEIDTLIVPSEQNVELFSKWHKNVKKVPLGVNPDIWHYRERSPAAEEFRFFIQGQGRRKGIDVAVRAFTRVFGDYVPRGTRAQPVLYVKSRPRVPEAKGDNVVAIHGLIPPAAEVELYAGAHCVLGLSRGEGFGLMPFQAMAQGCPSIIADAHGFHEYAHLASETVSTSMSKAERFIFGEAGQWWEPDFEEVCAAMWEMYANYDSYLAGAKASAQVIAENYTWDHCARHLIEAMGGKDALGAPDIETRCWHKPLVLQFFVIPNKHCFYEVNGITHTFEQGERYWVYGDIKRQMYENDNLDDRCLGDPHEAGLSPNQLEEKDRYRSEKARCRACGQMLNTDLSLDFDDELENA